MESSEEYIARMRAALQTVIDNEIAAAVSARQIEIAEKLYKTGIEFHTESDELAADSFPDESLIAHFVGKILITEADHLAFTTPGIGSYIGERWGKAIRR